VVLHHPVGGVQHPPYQRRHVRAPPVPAHGRFRPGCTLPALFFIVTKKVLGADGSDSDSVFSGYRHLPSQPGVAGRSDPVAGLAEEESAQSPGVQQPGDGSEQTAAVH